MVKIVTDGSCLGNQNENNVGGWGSILLYKGHRKELKGSQVNTTNNVMEMTAVIEALRAMKRKDVPVAVYSDSSYLINGLQQKWYEYWQTHQWKNKKKEDVKNKELWQEILRLKDSFSQISFYKIKGHLSTDDEKVKVWYNTFVQNEHPISFDGYKELLLLNHQADALATSAASERQENDKE